MSKSKTILSLWLFIAMSVFLSCYDVTSCEAIATPDIAVNFRFTRFQNTLTSNNFFFIAQITEDNMDSVVLSCHFSCAYLRFTSRDKEPKYPPVDRIPEVTAKVTSEKGGDTEYYEFYWDNLYRGELKSNGIIGTIPVFAQRSSILPIVYDTNKAIADDGTLSVSPEGDRLLAEMVFQNKKYVSTIDVKPKSK